MGIENIECGMEWNGIWDMRWKGMLTCSFVERYISYALLYS